MRKEVRFLNDTFDLAEGGVCIAAGNGIVANTPLENIEALFEEAVTYGAAGSGGLFDAKLNNKSPGGSSHPTSSAPLPTFQVLGMDTKGFPLLPAA
ncbi:MAG: hypothetical protein GF344_10780 [Chitinivibrionales bacterium]|nr:hypothetical protein [Chitinivibrionales bacterium]MBD3357288.1 hypothetical protein [Chitinivibrionales bacterium]